MGINSCFLFSSVSEIVSNFIQTIEKRQGKKVACIEEIAFNMGYINLEELNTLAQTLQASEYGQYLLKLTTK